MTDEIIKDEVLENETAEETKKEFPENGDTIEGKVINIQGTSIYVDLSPFGTGVIFGKEYLIARDIIRTASIGDTITGKIVELENEDGYIELSLREAKQAIAWSEAAGAIKNKTVLEVLVKDANKGGLIIEWQGVMGFLPASQMTKENYPKVEDGDKDKIIDELRKFIGSKMNVTILSADPKEGKLIFTESIDGKVGTVSDRNIPDKYSVGDIFDCEITGIVDFGVFLKLEEGVEGLAHISELDWSLVDNPRALYQVGDKVKAKIIDIQGGKISLSIKALKEDPWTAAESKYKAGDTVNGVVIKHNKFGALVSIEEGVAGLVHISEFDSEQELRDSLELGKSYDFKINLFEPKERKLTLVYKTKPE